jgi:hypothetical protein
MKNEHPTLRDELIEKLNRIRDEKILNENQNKRSSPQYRPGGFASS